MPLFLVASLPPAKTDAPPGIYNLFLHLEASHLLTQHWKYLQPNTFVKIVKNNEESEIKLDYVFGYPNHVFPLPLWIIQWTEAIAGLN